jgi:hypothetical protein
MKRREFLTAALAAGPLGTLRACAAGGETLRIAAFQADVTPPLGSPLCHASVQPARQIVDPLGARGVVFLGAGRPLVLCSVDWVAISNAAHDAFRQALADAVGTSQDRVAVHTIHVHDAPGVDFSAEELLAAHGLGGLLFNVAAARQAIERTALAARKALPKAQRVTHLGYGKGKVENVASNRRLLGPDGRVYFTRMSSCRNKQAQDAPEGTIDPYVRLVSFWDGGRPLAALTYYACHPQSYYGKGGVSYDYVGMARALREKELPGVAMVHFDGAGGNVAAGKYNDGSPAMRPILADRLARGMKAAWDSMTKVPLHAADVGWKVLPVTLPVRDTLVESELAAALADAKLPPLDRRRPARQLSFLRRMKSGKGIELAALRIGPVAILHMPGELFVEYQLAAQKMRPDRFVCLAAYGDDGPGYIGTAIAYRQGGYETGPVSHVGPEVEEVLMEAMRRMLQD